jgi:diguanylate cyclase (GGDEF)-like protein/PAS domain S-box-containing protein
LPFVLAAGGMLAAAGYSWPRRRARGGRVLLLLCLAAALWSVCEGLLYLGLSTGRNLLITQVQYLGIALCPPLSLVLVLELFGPREWLRPRWLVPAFATAAVVVLLAWTNPMHRLLWSGWWPIPGDRPMLGLAHGPAFWGWLAYSYLILGCLALILGRQVLLSARIHRGQAVMVLAAVSLVWTANLVYVTGRSPLPNMDLTPLAFAGVAAALAWALARYGLLDVVPVAKSEVFQGLADGVVVLDRQARLIDLNPAAQRILGLDRDAVGAPASRLLRDQARLLERRDGRSEERSEVVVPGEDGLRTYELAVSRLADRKGRELGWLLVWRDVTRRKHLEMELKRLATTDPLTGLWNRRSLLEQGSAELARARRQGRELSVLMLDLDHFKRINDTLGHRAGDLMLQKLGAAWQEGLRAGDIFGRMGGEEFAVVLSDSGPDEAAAAARRLRRAAAGVEVEGCRVTASAGVASLRPSDASLEDLLHRADQALYRAKAAGRDRVVSAEKPGPAPAP